jgi:hypothetical protein
MKAIETSTKTDKKGYLKLNIPLKLKEKDVKVIILMEDADEDEETKWMQAMASNPAFDFLKDKKEDIYKITDGKPFNDKK